MKSYVETIGQTQGYKDFFLYFLLTLLLFNISYYGGLEEHGPQREQHY